MCRTQLFFYSSPVFEIWKASVEPYMGIYMKVQTLIIEWWSTCSTVSAIRRVVHNLTSVMRAIKKNCSHKETLVQSETKGFDGYSLKIWDFHSTAAIVVTYHKTGWIGAL